MPALVVTTFNADYGAPIDPGSDDHVLDISRSLADGPELSVGTSVTVLCGPARIQGITADMSTYTEDLARS